MGQWLNYYYNNRVELEINSFRESWFIEVKNLYLFHDVSTRSKYWRLLIKSWNTI